MLLSRGSAQRVVLGKLPIATLCALLLGAALAPVRENFTSAPRDGFPFSYYPMFSRPVGDSYEVTHAVGIDREGDEHAIPHALLGAGGLNEALSHVRREARRDPEALCAQIARALRDRGSDDELGALREVVLVTGVYLLPAFYEGRIEARSKSEHARCPVPL